MSAEFHPTYMHEWRRLEFASKDERTMPSPSKRGFILLLLIPILLFVLYLTLPLISASPSAQLTNETLANNTTVLRLDPTCSPFAALTACVTPAQSAPSTMGVWQPPL